MYKKILYEKMAHLNLAKCPLVLAYTSSGDAVAATDRTFLSPS